jgi:hypothetical protein
MKYKEEEAEAKEALMMESIKTPGKTKEMYGTPEKSSILVPITLPKMKIYSAADITGATRVWITTRKVRCTSLRSMVYRPIELNIIIFGF